MTWTRWNLNTLTRDQLQDLSRALSDEWQERSMAGMGGSGAYEERDVAHQLREHGDWMREAMARASAVAAGSGESVVACDNTLGMAESRAYVDEGREREGQSEQGQNGTSEQSGVTPRREPSNQPGNDRDTRERQAYRAGMSRGWDDGYRVGRMRERMERDAREQQAIEEAVAAEARERERDRREGRW